MIYDDSAVERGNLFGRLSATLNQADFEKQRAKLIGDVFAHFFSTDRRNVSGQTTKSSIWQRADPSSDQCWLKAQVTIPFVNGPGVIVTFHLFVANKGQGDCRLYLFSKGSEFMRSSVPMESQGQGASEAAELQKLANDLFGLDEKNVQPALPN